MDSRGGNDISRKSVFISIIRQLFKCDVMSPLELGPFSTKLISWLQGYLLIKNIKIL